MILELRRTLHESLLGAHRRLEVFRVRTRLLGICASLEKAPPPSDPALARKRHLCLESLREYALKSEFPKNTDFPDTMTPYIQDRAGTRCALAHMIESSGDGWLVRRLARTDNHLLVPRVRRGPLPTWLARSGLTQEEAARIQVPYMPMPMQIPMDPVSVITQAAPGLPLDSIGIRLLALAVGLLAWTAWKVYRARKSAAVTARVLEEAATPAPEPRKIPASMPRQPVPAA